MEEDVKRIWDDVLVTISESMGNSLMYRTWFESIVPVKIRDNTLYLAVQSEINKNMLSLKYLDVLKEAVAGRMKQETEIYIHVGDPSEIADSEDEKRMEENRLPERNHTFQRPAEYGNLNPRNTFESFVIGNSNRFAHAACLAVADSLSDTYNPLFIYGGVGLGKTHLMQAIGNHVTDENPGARVVYVTMEKFMNEMISSISSKTNEKFREKYRNDVDVLLLDDIQFIAGKVGTQEELFHTFNELKESNKQIILSSDRPPIEIPQLEDRLRTRFASGLVADIQPPDLETRVAILKKKTEVDRLIIDDEILLFIATKVRSNIRELEGALNKVFAYSRLINLPITTEVAEKSLEGIVADRKNREITVDFIIELVANYYNISTDDIKGKVRTRNIAVPRQIAMYLSRELTNISLLKIGEYFGKDHSTVIHACSKISELKDNDTEIKSSIDSITQKLKTE